MMFGPRFRSLSVGLLVAIFSCAFDQMSVTAAMPAITSDLGGGAAAYSAAFVIPMALSLIFTVAGGIICDYRGIKPALITGSICLALGLVLAICAPTVIVFLLARGIQGIGIGTLIVAIYALISYCYPKNLHGQVFAWFSLAWLFPSLLGPTLAGLITQSLSWHMIFVITLVLLAAGAIGMAPSVVRLRATRRAVPPTAARRLRWAVVLGVVAAAITGAAKLPLGYGAVVIVVCLVVIVACLHRLTPPGTLRGTGAVGRVVATRGAIDMLLAGEIYLPLLLAEKDHLSPLLVGIGLSVSGAMWCVGSLIQQAGWAQAMAFRHVALTSAVVACVGLITMMVSIFGNWPWPASVTGWGAIAFAIGFSYPRINATALELAGESDTGFVSSALQVVGSTGMAALTATCAVIISAHHRIGFTASFGLVYLLIAAVSLSILLSLWAKPARHDAP